MSEEVVKVVRLNEQVGFKYKGLAYQFTITPRLVDGLYTLALYSLSGINTAKILGKRTIISRKSLIDGKFLPIDEQWYVTLRNIIDSHLTPKIEEITDLGEL